LHCAISVVDVVHDTVGAKRINPPHIVTEYRFDNVVGVDGLPVAQQMPVKQYMIAADTSAAAQPLIAPSPQYATAPVQPIVMSQDNGTASTRRKKDYKEWYV
jgi:hypothetical protein